MTQKLIEKYKILALSYTHRPGYVFVGMGGDKFVEELGLDGFNTYTSTHYNDVGSLYKTIFVGNPKERYYITKEKWDSIFGSVGSVKTLDEQIEYAQTLLNIPIVYEMLDDAILKQVTNTFTTAVVVIDWKQARVYSKMVIEEFVKNNGKPIVILTTALTYPSIPIGAVIEKAVQLTVKLNDTYSAIVKKDRVEVGCQTFPISILQELLDAHAKL